METHLFKFLSVECKITHSDSEIVSEKLKSAFAAFDSISNPGNLAVQNQADFLEIELLKQCPSHFPFGLKKVFSFRNIEAFGFGPNRACHYPDGTWTYNQQLGRNKRRICLGSNDDELLFDHAYKIIQSAVSEFLELRGYHRLHAVGFFDATINQDVLIYAQPGAGKSTLGYQSVIKKNPTAAPKVFSVDHLYSDESPLIHSPDLTVTSFPLPIGILNPATGIKERHFWQPYPRTVHHKFGHKTHLHIVFSIRIRPNSKIVSINRISGAIRLFIAIVLGLGLVQLAEQMLRFTPWLALDRILVRRLWLWCKLTISPRVQFSILKD